MNINDRLASLGLTLPPAPKPVAAYVPAVRAGELVVVSGQLPFQSGRLVATGTVPSATPPDLAAQAARQCCLNALAVLGDQIAGDWGRLVRVVRLGVFIASDAGFYEQPQVANGASDLLLALLGEAGRHARAAVGVNVLPLNASVELEMMAQVRD